MRLFAAVFFVLLTWGLTWGSQAAMAQGYCPFVAFCDAQHYHCYRNCGALTDVVAWPARPPFLATMLLRLRAPTESLHVPGRPLVPIDPSERLKARRQDP